MRNPPETPPLCHCCPRSPDYRSFLNGLPISPDKTPIRPPPSSPFWNLASLPLETPQSSTGDDAGEFQLHPCSSPTWDPHPPPPMLACAIRLEIPPACLLGWPGDPNPSQERDPEVSIHVIQPPTFNPTNGAPCLEFATRTPISFWTFLILSLVVYHPGFILGTHVLYFSIIHQSYRKNTRLHIS